jgi:hypothetical protein
MTTPFLPVALEHASRLLNHGPTVLVTSAHGGRRNIMGKIGDRPRLTYPDGHRNGDVPR